jgi:hypothetical protein
MKGELGWVEFIKTPPRVVEDQPILLKFFV